MDQHGCVMDSGEREMIDTEDIRMKIQWHALRKHRRGVLTFNKNAGAAV